MSDVATNNEAESCTHRGYADGDTVADFRDRLQTWLSRTVDLGEERVCDIVLAANEALANAADHAYGAFDNSGLVSLDLSYEAFQETVTIRVTDQGRWLDPEPTAVNSIRGQGLHLMRALADACTVDGRADGTSVTLVFHDCPEFADLASRFGVAPSGGCRRGRRR